MFSMHHALNHRAYAFIGSLLLLALAGCGGGGDTTISVTNVAANNVQYSRTMTVNVSGAGLDNGNLNLEVSGVTCANVRRTDNPVVSFQATFTCAIEGVGSLMASIKDGDGRTYGRVQVTVPTPQVTFAVTQGILSKSFVVELNPVDAPITSLNFMRYVNAGFYSNTLFHRVLPSLIAQGGQYGTDRALKTALFSPIKLESRNGLKNLRGTIAMARQTEPDTASAQFYFNIADNPAFDYQDETLPGYAVFGSVVSGQDVVDEISRVETFFFNSSLASLPVRDIVIRSVAQTK
jgi:cyclophilin family peptidyl-prolyl cis-trans isomerase